MGWEGWYAANGEGTGRSICSLRSSAMACCVAGGVGGVAWDWWVSVDLVLAAARRNQELSDGLRSIVEVLYSLYIPFTYISINNIYINR